MSEMRRRREEDNVKCGYLEAVVRLCQPVSEYFQKDCWEGLIGMQEESLYQARLTIANALY